MAAVFHRLNTQSALAGGVGIVGGDSSAAGFAQPSGAFRRIGIPVRLGEPLPSNLPMYVRMLAHVEGGEWKPKVRTRRSIRRT
jgi:hypothetical protein